MRNRISYKAIYSDDDYISHYGVLGMRWGHRKQRLSKGVAKKPNNKSRQTPSYSEEKAKRRLKEMKQQNSKVNHEIHILYKEMRSGRISEKEYLKKYRQLSKIHKANLAEYLKIHDEYGRKMYDWTY